MQIFIMRRSVASGSGHSHFMAARQRPASVEHGQEQALQSIVLLIEQKGAETGHFLFSSPRSLHYYSTSHRSAQIGTDKGTLDENHECDSIHCLQVCVDLWLNVFWVFKSGRIEFIRDLHFD
jgi:hypothetical protein